MHKYPKMLNLFKFDEETKGRRSEPSCPEFGYLMYTQWIWTEKIDGTNIRVIFDGAGNREVRGRTDKANLKQNLVDAVLRDTEHVELEDCTLYGEGYGAGIQKGTWYRQDQGFLLFDVFRHVDGGGYWLSWEDVAQIAVAYVIPRVPSVATCTPWDAYKMVQAGLHSTIGDGFAEGLVGRPVVPVRGVKGERLIVKVKHRDYYGKELRS